MHVISRSQYAETSRLNVCAPPISALYSQPLAYIVFTRPENRCEPLWNDQVDQVAPDYR